MFYIFLRFGKFNVDAIHYAPVCLNSLLFQYENDLSSIYSEIGNQEASNKWKELANKRKALFDKYLWDEDHHSFYDYNFVTKKRRIYDFATMCMPLWVGLASPQQATFVLQKLLSLERSFGLMTSSVTSGCQWDAPYGWAPNQLMAVEGLHRYGFESHASRIATKFLSVISRNFSEFRSIFEKYDVEKGSIDIEKVEMGYLENEIGFGWTNGVFLVLDRYVKERLSQTA